MPTNLIGSSSWDTGAGAGVVTESRWCEQVRAAAEESCEQVRAADEESCEQPHGPQTTQAVSMQRGCLEGGTRVSTVGAVSQEAIQRFIRC